MRRDDLIQLLPAITQLCAAYGVTELAVFGSVARGDERQDSDVDLLYVRGPNAVRGLAFFGLEEDLEKLLGTHVDLVPKNGLNRLIRDEVLADAEVIYAAA
ncbi:nucleotidyltransferase family protein [Nocardia sp. NPDC058497]|uniref:nucleotidyltransferase family protein n=1 Tax=Nocardia sp. NPDC058497 TaxID=3346529 RepID=UPI003663C27F